MALSLKCYLCGSDLIAYSNEILDDKTLQNITCKRGHKYSIDDTALTQLALLSRKVRGAAQETVEKDNALGKLTLFEGNSILDFQI